MKFVLLIALGVTVALAKESQVVKDFAVGNKQFTADVYKELVKSNPGNFLVCPISAEIILALVYSGASGQTAQQLSTALHLSESKEKIQQTFQEVVPQLQISNIYTALTTANKLYIKDASKIKDQFKSTAVNVFGSEIQSINFGNKVEAASEINGWVEKKTQDRIKNVISESGLDKDTTAVLINTLYFAGKWPTKFETFKNTQPFYLNNKDQIEVNMMRNVDRFNYCESSELKAKFLELPYISNDITMTFVLPNDKEGLPSLEAHIADALVAPHYNYVFVDVNIPKFKTETKTEFTPILKALGVVDAFEDSAKFEDIVEDQSLKISKVVQKTFIDVDEDGTVAAAATGLVLIPKSDLPGPEKGEEFTADHPFIYYIKIKDVVIFVGRYNGH